MDYQEYTSIDFVLDDDFFQWVMQPDAASDSFWQEWLEQHPHKRREVEEARKWILELSERIGKTEPKEMPEKENLWKRIISRIEIKSKSSDNC